jgi:hypothetical protein
MGRVGRAVARVVGVLVTLAAVSGLAACTPGKRKVSALRNDAGRPVLGACHDFCVSRRRVAYA